MRPWLVCLLLTLLFLALDVLRLGSEGLPLSEVALTFRRTASLVLLSILAAAGLSRLIPAATRLLVGWIFLATAILTSGVFRTDLSAIAVGLWFLSAPLLIIFCLPKILPRFTSLIPAALIFAAAPYLLFSVATTPLSYSYRGVTANPNSLGVIAATCGTALIILLVGSLQTHTLVSTLSLIPCLTLVIGALLLSASRTSLIATLLVLLAGLLSARTTLGRLVRAVIFHVVVIAVMAGGLAMYHSDSVIVAWDSLVNKLHTPRGSLLNSRDQVWLATLADTTVLGGGENYFNDTFGISAHNTVLEFWGKYGAPAGCMVILLAILSLIDAIKYRSRFRADPYACAPLLIWICFWVLSTAESMLGLLGGALNCAFIITSGVCSARLSHTPSFGPRLL